jgi:gas vesicle protein
MTTCKKTFCSAIVLLAATTIASAREVPPSEQLENKIAEIKMRYQPKIDALRAAGEAATRDMPSKEEMLLGTSVMKMKRIDWYVKVPELVLKHQTWYVRIPEFKMELQRIVWHMPEPCMQYMNFPWGGGMHVPGVCMREKDWRFHVPAVTVREQKWILGIPEVSMKEQHWLFDVPEIKIEPSKKRIDQAKENAEVVGQEGQQIADQMSDEIKTAVRDYLTETRMAVAEKFDEPISAIKASLAVAPAQAKAELGRKLTELEKARTDALQNIDDQLRLVS